MTNVPQITQIILPTQLTDEQRRLMVKYVRLPRSVTGAEWGLALATFDQLHGGRVTLGIETLTFQAFYLRFIDNAHATPFIEEVLAASDIEAEGTRLAEEHWRQIVAVLTGQGIVGDVVEVRALLAYCLYWWRSFSKGYIREALVFHDLEQSGIDFDAHDLRDHAQRRSAYDLTVLGRRGDVKTSTYFLHTARTFPLRCDFYIVRLWDDVTNQWLDLVLLKPDAWRELDGEPTPCAWETVARALPTVAQVKVRGESLVVVPYAEWKTRVLSQQSQEGGNTL
ncbi:hypothetical protein HYR99_42125 [Candidatus Poribacteria bacterium]|nr:hypothetical protein [Candidatus Poribacteria bacterium]